MLIDIRNLNILIIYCLMFMQFIDKGMVMVIYYLILGEMEMLMKIVWRENMEKINMDFMNQ